MAGVAGLLVMLLMAAAEASVGSSNSSSFCTETEECLLFEPVCKTEEYEVRHYDPARWVSTDAESLFMEVGTTVAYRRLFKYITGANEDGVKINMTAPILIKIPEEKRKWKATVYTLSFLLPSAYQENPPKPTNEKVYFTDMSDMTVYVRSYGGWILSVTSGLHSHLLRKDLNGAQASYNNSFNYAVGYDSPMKLLHRHNEVWYVAEGEPVCSLPTRPPSAGMPNTTNPDATNPNTTVLSTTGPSTTALNVTAPNATTPNTTAPNVTAPLPTVA